MGKLTEFTAGLIAGAVVGVIDGFMPEEISVHVDNLVDKFHKGGASSEGSAGLKISRAVVRTIVQAAKPVLLAV